MTFLVMVSMGDCVILAADRAVLDMNTGELVNENARKITKTARGYITASGAAELIEPVKTRLQAEPPKTVSEMEEIFEDARLLFLARNYGSPDITGWVERSSWKLTIPKENEIWAVFTSPDGLRGLREGMCLFTYPTSVSATDRAAVDATQFKYRAKGGQTSIEDIDHNLAVIMQVVARLKAQGHPVSDVIDFAIDHLNGQQELTSEQLHRQ